MMDSQTARTITAHPHVPRPRGRRVHLEPRPPGRHRQNPCLRCRRMRRSCRSTHTGNITRDRLSSWFKNRGIPDFRPDAVGAAARRRLSRRPPPSWPPVSAHRCPTNTGSARPARSSTWRDVNCFENDFSEELGELLASARRLVGPLPHREDQGQRGPPRLLARCGPERQPAEALDDRGRAAGAGQVGARLRQVPGTVQREDRQRAVLAAARRGRLRRLRARGRRLHEVGLPLQAHDRPGRPSSCRPGRCFARRNAPRTSGCTISTCPPAPPTGSTCARTWRRCSSSTTSWRTSIGTGTTSACSSTARAGNGSARRRCSTPAKPFGATVSSPSPSAATRRRGPA